MPPRAFSDRYGTPTLDFPLTARVKIPGLPAVDKRFPTRRLSSTVPPTPEVRSFLGPSRISRQRSPSTSSHHLAGIVIIPFFGYG